MKALGDSNVMYLVLVEKVCYAAAAVDQVLRLATANTFTYNIDEITPVDTVCHSCLLSSCHVSLLVHL